ncbi:MAG TPA: BrnT family toxin [Stellaceae bacterium]|nr:BrnT family toxin [Stellaceae bacterium]
MDDFEWDPKKELLNIHDHHLDFTTASRIWDGNVYERLDDRRDYGESRIVAIGEIAGRASVVVFTWRGEIRRMISARKANAREKRRFEAEIQKRRNEAET